MKKITYIENVKDLLSTMESFEEEGEVYLLDAKYPTPTILRWFSYYLVRGLAFLGAQFIIGFWLSLILYMAVYIANAIYARKEIRRALSQKYKIDVENDSDSEFLSKVNKLKEALENCEHITIQTQIIKLKTK